MKIIIALIIALPMFSFGQDVCPSGAAYTATAVRTFPTCTSVVSMVPAFSGSTPGLVPNSTGGNSTFLRSDGSWAVPASDFAPYPPAGIPNSTGTAWGASYTTIGTGSVLALANAPTFSGLTSLSGGANFGSSGQISIDASGNLGIGYTGSLPIPWPFTLGTTGQFHSDAAGNVFVNTLNGIGLHTTGAATNYLGEDGNYHVLPSGSALLGANNTWTGTNTFTNSVVSNLYSGQFSSVYGTIVLGSGSGATIEKTVSDATAVIVASQNTATTGTGDYFDAKDPGGSVHRIVDHSLNLFGTTFNGASLSLTSGKTILGPNILAMDGNGNVAIDYAFPFPTSFPYALSVGTNAQFHVDISGNATGTSFNGVELDSGGSSSLYLNQAGGYTVPGVPYPLTVGDGVTGHGEIQTSTTGTSIGNNGQSQISIDSSTNSILLGATGAGNIYIYTDVAGGGATAFNSSPSMPGLQVNGGGASVQISTLTGSSGRFAQSLSSVNGVITTVQTTTTIPVGDVTAWNGTQLVDGGPTSASICPAGKPIVTAGPGAGTSGTPGITVVGTNCDFQVQLNTSSAPAAGQNILLITYANPFPNYSGCQKELDQNSLEDPGSASMYMQAGYANRAYLNAGTTALAALTNHTIWFHCGGN